MYKKLCHRSKIDIIWSILDFIEREGVAGKTHVLYAANLNSRSFKKFIDELIDIGAIGIKVANGRSHYTLTTYGYKLLSLLTNVREILSNKSLIRAKIFANKTVSEIIRGKLENNEDILIEYSKHVHGNSDLGYNVDIVECSTGSYAMFGLSINMNKEDVVNVLGKSLLILMDTSLKCIFIISRGLDYFIPIFRNVFDKVSIDHERYIFIVIDEQWFIN